MAADALGIKQRAIMFALMAEAREMTNAELYAACRQRLDGAARTALNERGLVRSKRRGRGFVHELDDKGWVWCAQELTSEPPARSGSAGGAMYAVLRGLRRYLDRSGKALADVFQPDAEALVRSAYVAARDRPGAWVMLSTLRDGLPDLSRVDLDDALTQMISQSGVHLAPESNQQALTAEHRAASVRIGGQDKHMISIEDA